MEHPPRLTTTLERGKYIGTVSSGVLHSLMRERGLSSREVEGFILVAIDDSNTVIATKLISTGGPTTVVVSLTNTFREAIIASEGEVRILVAHNHPDGNPHPSQLDVNLTARLRESSALLCIEFVDHLVIGEESFYSFTDSSYYHYSAVPTNVVKFGIVPVETPQPHSQPVYITPQAIDSQPSQQIPEGYYWDRHRQLVVSMPLKPNDVIGFTWVWSDIYYRWRQVADLNTVMGRFWHRAGMSRNTSVNPNAFPYGG